MASGIIPVTQDLSSVVTYYNNQNVIDTAIDTAMLVGLSATYNTSLYTALGDTFAYIIQIFYNNRSSTSNRVQIAYPYTGTVSKMAWRIYRSGWGSWHVVTADN